MAHGPDGGSGTRQPEREPDGTQNGWSMDQTNGSWTRWSMDQINGSWTRQVAQGPDRWSMVWMEHGKQKSIYVNGTWRARNVPEMMPRS